MPGRRNVLGIFLGVTFGGEKIIVAAAPTRVGPTNSRSCLVDRAASLVGIEEAADLAEMHIRLAAHGILLVAILFGELSSGCLKAQSEVSGEATDIAFGQRNDGIGTAIAWTFRAIVHG